ncbi:MAG TPA: bifunctional alpha,alpha-trehalose-phosphate synthase (UDP-forming)/trehalose-phosphatase [Flavisolibacter sp.]
MNENRLFIVANRLPVTVVSENDALRVQPASGGLVSAIKSYLDHNSNKFSEVCWAGVPGCTESTWQKAAASLEDATYTYVPVVVSKDHYEKYYNGFSNSILWPLFHYFPSYAEYNMEDFNDYRRVNEYFFEVLKNQCRPGDTVWIHDYHLLLLAGMLRKAIPELTIGLFLHIPFPSFELDRLLPRKWQQELLEGMLGADLVGFHTMDYAMHFLQTVQLTLGLSQERNIVRFMDRLVKTDVFPISIDYHHFHDAYGTPKITAMRESLREKMGKRRIIFSVDRLDYTKGVHNRLKAYEYFLEQNPQYHNKVVFIIVVVPSRDHIPKYAERKRMIDEMISRINSHIGSLHWQPVIYQYNTLSFEEMMALYSICDVALITPLRDGMNLVSKEFVASRKDHRGVLVLSEMAGAARELTDALIINPNDTLEMADKIREALEMPEAEQAARLAKMQKRISNYDVQAWASDFLTSLARIKKKQQTFQEIFLDEEAVAELLASYGQAGKRLLLLDYDGTLVPFTSKPELAVPGTELLELLSSLATIPGNDVFLISGRSSAWLDEHFGSLSLNLISEHGARVRWKNKGWKTEVQTHSEWKEHVHNIMEMYERRCANAFVEEKEFSIVWHYRNADPEQGRLRATELMNELKEYIHERRLEIMAGNMIVEVRNRGIDKGTAIKKILSKQQYDFVFAVGDDRTDEDMFKTLVGKPNCFTVKVGPNASYAQYNVMKPEMVIELLNDINKQRLQVVLPPVD